MKAAGHRPFILHDTAQRTCHNQIKRASIPLSDHNEKSVRPCPYKNRLMQYPGCHEGHTDTVHAIVHFSDPHVSRTKASGSVVDYRTLEFTAVSPTYYVYKGHRGQVS